MKKIILFAIILILVFTNITGCISRPPSVERVTLSVAHWPASAAFYVAQDKGYFTEQGLEVVFHNVATGLEGINSVLSGTADFCGAADTPIALNALNGKPIAVIATLAEIDQAILILAGKESGISAAPDLEGKKIGVTTGTGAEFFLNIYLAVNNISNRSIQIVNIPPDKIVNALLNEEVDAVATWSPHYLELQEKLGNDAVVLADPNLYTQTWNLVIAQDLAKNNPERITKFLRAIIQANHFIQDHPQDARSISAKYIGTESSIYESDWPHYHFTAILNQSLILNLEDQARWTLQNRPGEIKTIPNFLDFIDTTGLKAVQPDAVRITQK